MYEVCIASFYNNCLFMRDNTVTQCFLLIRVWFRSGDRLLHHRHTAGTGTEARNDSLSALRAVSRWWLGIVSGIFIYCIVMHKSSYCFQHVLAIAILFVHPSICSSVCPSVTRVDQSKTVQARITKSSPSGAWKTLVSETVKLFHKFEGVTPNEGAK